MSRIETVVRGAPLYPLRLEELPDPPPRVWYAGSLPRAPAAAIVGTRRADPDAIQFASQLARELAVAGVSIVSGGAAGIDAGAHRGALLGLGHTTVVQAAALSEPYPRSHRALFAQILERGGGWISETPPGMPPQPHRFLARNRLIAALADLVVVVQAPSRSGALSTARHAQALDRPIFGVPAAPWDPRAAGVLDLLAEAARMCRGSHDLAAYLGVPRVISDVTRELPPPKTEDAARVLAALSSRPAHPDALAQRTGLPIARVHAALVELATSGHARQQHGAWRS